MSALSRTEYVLQAQGAVKRFGRNVVLQGVDLAIPRGEIVSIIGKSGVGKSVLLKCLAGLLVADEGDVLYDGYSLRDDPSVLVHLRQKCSYLFQGNALFDGLTALENVALPLEATTNLSNSEIRRRSLDVMARLELVEHRKRYPQELSGGMQKRLALARALVTGPEVVLFDEPTAGLDPLRRNAVFSLIVDQQRHSRFTAVLVTHDLPEALVASDRVALLDEGRILFQGTPRDFEQSEHPTLLAFRDSAALLRQSLACVPSPVEAKRSL